MKSVKSVTPAPRPSGFTLIEILVVISIIALLISILLPVLKNARDQARTIACASNTRQAALAASIYADDNDEDYPALNAHGWLPGASCYLWETSGASRAAFAPYITTGQFLYCPNALWRNWDGNVEAWYGPADLPVGYAILFGEHPDVDSPQVRFINYSGTGNADGTYPVKTLRGVNDTSERVLITDIYRRGAVVADQRDPRSAESRRRLEPGVCGRSLGVERSPGDADAILHQHRARLVVGHAPGVPALVPRSDLVASHHRPACCRCIASPRQGGACVTNRFQLSGEAP